MRFLLFLPAVVALHMENGVGIIESFFETMDEGGYTAETKDCVKSDLSQLFSTPHDTLQRADLSIAPYHRQNNWF